MSATAFNDIKYKASSGQINLDEAQGIVECFVAGIGNKDSVGDVCSSGAFTKSLLRRKPRVVWGHNWNDPIGKVLEIYEVPPSDPRLPGKMRAAGIGGLYARVQFNLNSEKGREAFANVAFFGEDQEWSIGYKTIRAQFDQASQANILSEVELYEVSPVLHGANQLTGTISIKADEVGMTSSSPASAVPYGDESASEGGMQAKLEAELTTRLGASVKVANVSDGMVHFTRTEQDGKSSMYKCRFSYGNDGVFMFGRPELVLPPTQSQPNSMPMVKPVEMPSAMPNGMPMGQRRPQAGVPTPPGQTIVVPSTLPGATPASPPLVRVNYQQPSAPIGVPKIVPEERDLAEALIKITKRYGKFNEDSTGVWAGYKSPAENPVAKIGVKCANCVLYEGEGKCKIIAMAVEPEGKCRFAVIPDGVVTMGPVQKMNYDMEVEEEEVKWVEDIEEKYPGEFISGTLRGAVKRRRRRRVKGRKLFTIDEYKEKSLDDFADMNQLDVHYVLPVNQDNAFEIKQLLDPIIDYHRVDAYVEDGGIILTNGVTKDFVDAVDAALKGLGNYPFFQSEKALGQGIGAGGNLAGRVSRAAAVFNPNAWDGDNDGLVQEGTPFQRPAIPGVNDFATRGRVNPERALDAFVNGQGGEVSATGQVLPPRRTIGATDSQLNVNPAKKPTPSLAQRAANKPLKWRPEDRSIGKGPRITNAEMDEFSASVERADREREKRGLSSGGVAEGIAESELFAGSKWIEQVYNENLEMDVIPARDVYGPDQSGYTVVGRYRTEDGEDWLYGGDDEIFETVADALDFIDNYDRQIADEIYPDDPKFQSLDRARTTGKTRANRGLSSGREKDFLPQSDSKLNSEKGKEKLTPEQMWEEGILGYTLDDLAERTGMTRQEVRKAQLDFIKSNSNDPEFRNRENDLRVHAEYMAQMEKLGIYPPGNPDYYSGSKDEKMAKAREAAAQVGLSVEEASAEADPRYWDYLTNKGTTSRLGLSSGKGGETPEERNNRQIYERRVTTGESLDDVANALGMTREDVRRSEMLHAKRLRDESLRMSLKDETPREKRDREIFDRRSTTGISIDALAEETGMSRSDIRQAEMRHASRLRNEPMSPREERKNRLSSGRTASDGGKLKPKSNPENVKRKASKDRQKLSSGESLDWTNPSDGLPSNMDNWTDNDWETYGARRYVQRERRGSRPFGKALSNGLREEIGSSVLPSKDGSPQYGMHTSDRGYASVGKDEDGTWSATRLVFDDYEGYHTDDYDYDLGYEQGGFNTPEEASDWLASKIEEDGAYIYGDEKRDAWAKDKSIDASSDETSIQDAWAEYFKKQDEANLLGKPDDGPNDVIRIQPGLSSGKSPYQMGGRIAAQVNKKIPPRTNYDYSPDGDRIPTEEQKTVIDAVMTGQNVLVPALAGTGKTSTLVSLAKRMKTEQPDKNLLYLAFNASAARDAERRFAGLNNVEVVTLDGIGKRWIEESRGKVGKRFSSRIDVINAGNKKKQSTVPEETFVPLNGRAIAKQLGLKTQVVDGREMSGDDIAKLAINAVKQFEISSDGQIGLQHFLDNKGKPIPPDAMPGNILDIANMHWKDKSGDDGTSIIQFNTLNKMWALSEPDFSEKGWGTKGPKDLVLYDEAQDLNPVWNAAAAGQSVQNVFVGDPNQAIYGFRGAVNELDSIAERSEYVLPITEVFRFGPEIAGYTNRALAILGIENNRMVGRGKRGEVVEPGTMTDATMVINRTNGGVIRSALDEINNGRTVATTPNAKKEVEKTINSIKKLRFNTPSNNLHPDLEEFENWKELEDAVSNGTATGKQESLYRLMSNITLSDFQKVSDNLQIWDPSAGNDTELPEDLLDGASFPNGIAFASDNGVIYLTGKTFENKQKIGATRGFTFNRTTSRWELNPASDEKHREILMAVRDISSASQGRNDKSVPRLEMPDSLDVRGDLGGGVKYEISGSSIALTGNTYNMGTILRAAGFSFDKDAKKWKNNTTRSEAERTAILESIVNQSIRESDAAKLADAKPSTGKPDVIVTTAHQAKGLETERGKLGSDWWGPKKDKVTGETVWPDEEHIHALYVALSRSMEVLDPGSASWITDWTNEDDELPNTRGGLSSGRAKRVKGQIATRRPWSEEERQAFAGGQRQRAQTIPGKRKEGPSASEFGPGTNRRNRRLSSGGLSSGGFGIDAGMGGLGIEEAKMGSNTADNPVNMKRRAVGGNVGGIGSIGARAQTKKTFLPFEGGSPNTEFRKNLERTTGSSRWKPTVGKLETNKQSDGKTPWMLEASKVLELFKDSDGRQLDDDEILTALGYISESTKKGEVSRNEPVGRQLLAELRKPGAAISEGDAAAILEAIYPEDDTLSTPGNERAREVWGFASAPRWLRKDGTAVSEEEFNSMSAKEIGKLSPDLGDFENFELPSGEFERPAAKAPKAATRASIGGRPLAEVNKKENFTADKLFDYLGIGDSDMSKSKRAALAAEVLKNEYNIKVSEKNIAEQWFKGISTDVIQHLLDTGKIPSVSEVFGEQNSSFEQYPTALSAKRKVFDSLIESGLSEDAAQRAFQQIFGGGTVYTDMLNSEQKIADYKSGKIPFAGSGTVVKYDEEKLGQIVDALNEARAKNGADPIDAGTLFDIKETAEAAAPKPSTPKAAPEAKPKGALIEQYPEVTRWENLSRSSAKNLSDDELDEAIGVLVALSNPIVKNVEGKLSYPDGFKPSDERVINAQDALEVVQAIAEDRRIKKGLDEIQAEFGWRSPGDNLPPFGERNAEQTAEFLKRGDILEQRNLIQTSARRGAIKSAWTGVSVRTKGDRAQRYKIA